VDVDTAAPSVCIRSTSLGSSYAELSGATMLMSHVAEAVALYPVSNNDATPDAVRYWLLCTA
jgi:hypothetical protein